MAQNVIRILTSSGWQDMTVQAANVTKAQAPIVLTRTSDGDTNGLIYWLGTRAGAFAPPVPEVNGGTTAIGEELRMYSSSTYPDGNYDLINMVDRVNNPGWAANVGTTEWVALDLKTRTLKPDQLTLKSRSDANSNHLKSFILEASQDGTNWTTLLTVANAAYTAVSQWKNWAVTPPAVGYRYLRVRSTGVDSTGGSSVIIGEFEIYGTLYLPDLPGATYQIQDEGVLLPLRGVMNFTGAGVTATDDAANGRTVVTVAIPVVTALPNPVVTPEVFYKVDENTYWHLRYNSAIADAYKWIAIGGPALWHEVMTGQAMTTGGPKDLGTLGPDVIVPLAGVYDVTVEMQGVPAVATYCIMTYEYGAGAAHIDDAAYIQQDATYALYGSSQAKRRKTITTAGQLVRAKYTSTGAATIRNRRLTVQPVRVG